MRVKKSATPSAFILWGISLGLLFLITYFYCQNFNQYHSPDQNYLASENRLRGDTQIDNQSCVSKTEERIVRGDSLSGLIESGQTIQILFGYYQCNEVKRNDIVAYYYVGNSEPIIKIIKALPGDSLKLKQTEDGWNILINGEILRNSEGKSYVLDINGHRMLSLYERDYKGVVPANTYLILGNKPSGSLDSTRFGLVDETDLVGKVKF